MMHSPILTALAAAALFTLTLPAPAAEAGCATVEVQNVRPAQGHLMVAGYTREESFGKEAAASLMLPAGEATMRFELCGLSGEFAALTLFQDLNSDGKMNNNLVGMPIEPWGASGHPGMMGPKWASTKVPLDGRTIVVQMAK